MTEPNPLALTGRQHAVLWLISQGQDVLGIAAELQLARRTVEFHVSALCGTLGLKSKSELFAFAVEHHDLWKMPPESIVCPQCGLRSYHPNDIAERYCGRCHQWHADMGNSAEMT